MTFLIIFLLLILLVLLFLFSAAIGFLIGYKTMKSNKNQETNPQNNIKETKDTESEEIFKKDIQNLLAYDGTRESQTM